MKKILACREFSSEDELLIILLTNAKLPAGVEVELDPYGLIFSFVSGAPQSHYPAY